MRWRNATGMVLLAAAVCQAAEDPLGCNPVSGLGAPLPLCTAANPCTNVASDFLLPIIDRPSDPPLCMTTALERPIFDDRPTRRWVDEAGTDRYHCVFIPPGTTLSSRRPLVIFLHGGGSGEASDLYNFTRLREKAETYDLAADPARPGFVLVSIQGRFLHYPTANPRDGRHHDFYYRDLAAPSTNPDVANVDRIIDGFVATGLVDPNRIYMVGWSNGGFFAQLYGIARHATSTPGGNRVAAVAVYSAADPFHNVNADQVPSCQLDPYPRADVPIFLVTRSCDLVACDAEQAIMFAAEGQIREPGHVAAPWVTALLLKVGNPNITWRRVSGLGTIATSCDHSLLCTSEVGVVNHASWPDGVADGSGIDHEWTMLGFLRDSPLP